MIEITIAELLDFYRNHSGDYAPAVKLRLLRDLVAERDGFQAECERMASLLAAKAAA